MTEEYHPDDPVWEFPHEIWSLPHNARTFGEMVSAPRRRYILADASDPRDEVIKRLVEAARGYRRAIDAFDGAGSMSNKIARCQSWREALDDALAFAKEQLK